MRLTILKKFFLIITILLVITLGATDFIWFMMIRPILTSGLQESQTQIGLRARDKVEDFLNAKLRTLIIHSQSAAFITANQELERLELLTLFAHDQDIQQISIINDKGLERLLLKRDGQSKTGHLTDRSKDPSFIITSFRYNKEYISEVQFIENKPVLTIAVPIIVPITSHRLTELSTERKNLNQPNEILGVMEIKVSIDNLFHELTSLGTDQSGYLYIINRYGIVISHKNKDYINNSTQFLQFPPVKNHVENIDVKPKPDKPNIIYSYINEERQEVLGTHIHIPATDWAVIVQQPNTIALADLIQVTTLAFYMLGAGIIFALPISFILSKRFTNPIHELVKGARTFGQGNLNYRVKINSNDEMREVSDAFNQMAENITVSRNKLEDDKNLISAERNKLAIILSGISDAVVAVDLDRKVILFNSSAEILLATKTENALNQSIDKLIGLYTNDEIITPEIYCPITSDILEGPIWQQKNIKLITAQGKITIVNIVASKIKDGKKVGVGCILTIHDVTYEQELEKMKLDFVSMAAHELRTPITSLRGYLELLQGQVTGKISDDEKTMLDRSIVSSDQLYALTENLLNVSRVEQGKLKLNLAPIALDKIVNDVIQDLEQLASQRRVKLIFEPSLNPFPLTLVDQFQIREVFMNLISNAINYNHIDGWVKVNFTVSDSILTASVSDNGQGISTSALPHLFSKFYRVSAPLEMGSKGTGLGLFISKKIIEAHNGKIWAESQENKGSKFHFSLNIKEDTPKD